MSQSKHASIGDVLMELGLMNWQTARLALGLELVGKVDLERLACAQIATEAHPSDALIALAESSHLSAHEISEALEEVTASEKPIALAVAKDRVRLAFLVQARRDTAGGEELMKRVAEAYGIFGYPRDMAGAVYYMPPDPRAFQARVGDQLQSPLVAVDALIEELKARVEVA